MKAKSTILNNLARAAMTLLVMTMTTAARAQTPYAIYCEGNNTFYFTNRTEALSVGDTFTPEAAGATAQTITAIWSGTDVTNADSPGWFYFGDNGAFVTSVETVVFEPSFANVTPTKTADWFYMFESLTDIQGIRNLDTSQVTDMKDMFFGCGRLTTLDISSFDTSKVTNMYSMFDGCGSLTTLDLSSFDTSQVTDMTFMFKACVSLTTLDLSSFNTSQVTDMCEMFYVCGSLTTLDISSFDTSQVTNMSEMFRECGSLTALDLSSFNTSQVTDMSNMFDDCGSLRYIYIGSGWNTENVEDSGGMFDNCSLLPNWNDGDTDKEHAHTEQDGYMLMHPMLTIVDDAEDNKQNIDDAITEADGRYEEICGNLSEEGEEGEEAAAYAKRNNVTLSGRTLYKDGEWNTLCLPFGMTAGQISVSPLAGADIRTLTSASVTGYVVKLTFGKVSSLTPGTPYIVRWDADTENPTINDPIFYSVTLSDETKNFTSEDSHVNFIGYYDAFTVKPDLNPAIYYLTAGNMLKHTATERKLKACRAYFIFTTDAGAGTNDFTFDIDFGDGTTGIGEPPALKSQTSTPFWYTLDGRRLSGEPTRKVIYLNNGRKVVIK